MSNIFLKEESTGCLTACHWEDKFLCTIWNIKWFQFPIGCNLHSKIFLTSPYTPKSKLKRRSYGPDKFEKKNWLLSKKKCRDIAKQCCNKAKKKCHEKANNCRDKAKNCARMRCRDSKLLMSRHSKKMSQ